MMEFLQKIKNTIAHHRMIAPGDLVLVGVSGGADSVALLLALDMMKEELGCFLRAVHVEHGLRGEDSLRDMAFTRQLCEERQIPCSIVQVDVRSRAREENMSTEEAARILRYEAFDRVKTRYKAQKIATAHHRTDQAETVLLNLCRGSGLTGLGGIRPVNGDRIRPLLEADREEAERFLEEIGQSWVVDETNAEDAYTRNRIRHHILPALAGEVNEKAVLHIAQMAEDVRAAQDYLERVARTQMAPVYTIHGEMHIPDQVIQTADPVIAECILRLAIRDLRQGSGLKDIGRVHIDALMQLGFMQTGKRLDLPDGLRAVKEPENLVLFVENRQPETIDRGKIPEECPLTGPEGRVVLKEGELRWRYISPEEVPDPVPESHCTKWLSYDTMSDEICLRTRRAGDYLIVDSRGGRKKLKDYLIDRKIPRRMRDELLLVAQGSHILWVIDGRISEGAKVQKGSGPVLRVEYKKKQEENHG